MLRPLKNLGSALKRGIRWVPELRSPNYSTQIDPLRNPNLSYCRQTDLVRDPNYTQIVRVRNLNYYCRQSDLVRGYPNYSTQVEDQKQVEDLNYVEDSDSYPSEYEDIDRMLESEYEDIDRMLEESLRGGLKVNLTVRKRRDTDYFAKYAVKDYNLKNNQQLKFVEMLKSTYKPSSGWLYGLIFKVEDKKDGKIKIFAGDVWYKVWRDSGWLKSMGLRHVG